jgi:hypothetical protein
MSKYSKKDIKLWADEYKKCYSFSEVGRVFGVDKGTIKRNLIKNKDEFDIKTKQDLHNEGLRRCSVCKEIKPLELFSAYKQKSRCKECIKKISSEYRQNNLEKCLIAERRWYSNNKKKKARYHKEYKIKQKDNIEFKLKKILRGRLWEAIRKRKKVGSAVKDLGCSVAELKKYLEKQFYDNSITGEVMSWDNYGYDSWHIDHIKPLESFDLTDRKQFLEACNYTNLQPLWSNDHNAKTLKDLKIIKQSKQEKDK